MIKRHALLWDRLAKARTMPWRTLLIGLPYAWLLAFFMVPFLLIFKISLSDVMTAVPPLRPVLEQVSDSAIRINLQFGHYYTIFADSFYHHAFLTSVAIAGSAALICLVIGYAIAYSISRAKPSLRPYLLLLIALPFWTSFLIRVYAWMALLSHHGGLNSLLLATGLISEPLEFLHNAVAVCLGIVYCYLPFMVFPVYSSLSKIDPSYLEAAHNLGCPPWRAFWKITVPLSKPGIMAGFMLVFIPAVGEFVIPELLGGAETMTIGRAVWLEFFNNRNWPLACALAVVMVLLFVLPMATARRRKV